jgi:hypothetical protein
LAAINFPTNPGVNQPFTAAGVTWVWDGTKWIMSAIAGGGGGGGGGGASIIISDNPPPNPIAGNLWFDSANGQLYVYYVDATSAQWVTVVNQGLGGQYLPLAGGSMTGTIASVSGNSINGPGGTTRNLFGKTSGSNRWELQLGSSDFETGANAGSNFDLVAYDDTGALLSIPLSINRATGAVTLIGPLTLPGNAVTPFGAATAQQIPGSNRIINGDMRINQRGAASGSAVGYTVDRIGFGAAQSAKITWGQGTGPGATAIGFPYYTSWTCPATPYTPIATDFFYAYQMIEADMISDFCWGSANAQPATLSFWASAVNAGTYGGSIRNTTAAGGTPTRSYPFTFALPGGSGIWTKIVVPIPGDPAGTWVMSGNGGGLSLSFDLGCGTSWRSAATPGVWQNGNFLGANGAYSVVSNANTSFFITGVKLEIGSVATPFNRQSLSKSLSDCQRYYQQPIMVFLIAGYNVLGGNIYNLFVFPTTMRAAPTITPSNIIYSNGSNLNFPQIDSYGFRGTLNVTAAGAGNSNFNATISAEF